MWNQGHWDRPALGQRKSPFSPGSPGPSVGGVELFDQQCLVGMVPYSELVLGSISHLPLAPVPARAAEGCDKIRGIDPDSNARQQCGEESNQLSPLGLTTEMTAQAVIRNSRHDA